MKEESRDENDQQKYMGMVAKAMKVCECWR